MPNENSINRDILVGLIATYGNVVANVDGTGEGIKIRDLVVQIEKRISEADVQRIIIDPYRKRRLLYSLWDFYDMEGSDTVIMKYREAFERIIWLNNYGRRAGFKSFITRYVDSEDLRDIKDVVDSFHMALRYPLMPHP